MLRRRFITLLSLLPWAGLARAATHPFDEAAFLAARKAGKPVLVYVHATWCPTCRKQEPAIQALLGTPEFAAFQVFKVDFDSQPDVLDDLRVTRQSTIIVYKGEKEVARATGVTQSEAIAAFLRKAS